MKRILLFTVVFCGILFGCHKDDDLSVGVKFMKTVVSTVKLNSFTFDVKVEGSAIKESGLCYATTTDPTTEQTKVVNKGDDNDFKLEVNGLTASTLYYVRAYAIQDGKTYYGELKSFTTLGVGMGTAGISGFANVTEMKATVKAVAIGDGGFDITERGVCYGTTINPDMDSKVVTCDKGLGEFTAELSGLIDETVYHVRAYCVNENGTSYSPDMTFQTVAFVTPSCVLDAPTMVTKDYFETTGSVTDNTNGLLPLIDCGVCYGESENPMISGSHLSCGVTFGVFNVKVTGLTAGRVYHVRTYATTRKGTVYGDERIVSTIAVPIIKTGTVTNILAYSALITGTEILVAGENLSEAGVCFGTTDDVTIDTGTKISQSKLAEGVIDDVKIGLLVPKSKYYARAYAINKSGVGYGDAVEVATIFTKMVAAPVTLPEDPTYYNMLRCYYEQSSSGSTTGQSEFQKGIFDKINSAMVEHSSGRNLDYIRLLFQTDLATSTKTFITFRLNYKNTKGSSYNITIDLQYNVDAQGIYTFNNFMKNLKCSDSNYNNMMGNEYIKPEIMALINYLKDNSFILDYEDAGVDNAVKLIPVNAPENFFKFSCVRLNGADDALSETQWDGAELL